MSVSIFLCAFIVLPLPHLAMLAASETAERDRSCQNEGESSEEEQAASSSLRFRIKDRRRCSFIRPHEIGRKLRQIVPFAGRFPAIVGHQLSNGLRAPLLT
jgi:hypothetical protein